MVPKARWFLLLKEMVILKLGLDLIKKFQKVMILVASAKKIMVSFVLVIVRLTGFSFLGVFLTSATRLRSVIMVFIYLSVQLTHYVLKAQVTTTWMSLPLMSCLR